MTKEATAWAVLGYRPASGVLSTVHRKPPARTPPSCELSEMRTCRWRVRSPELVHGPGVRGHVPLSSTGGCVFSVPYCTVLRRVPQTGSLFHAQEVRKKSYKKLLYRLTVFFRVLHCNINICLLRSVCAFLKLFPSFNLFYFFFGYTRSSLLCMGSL